LPYSERIIKTFGLNEKQENQKDRDSEHERKAGDLDFGLISFDWVSTFELFKWLDLFNCTRLCPNQYHPKYPFGCKIPDRI
jgi:hypothetical protein